MPEVVDREGVGELVRRHRWLRWGLGLVAWSALGLSFAVSSFLGSRQNGAQVNWKPIVFGYLSDFIAWGLLSPLVFRLARRFDLRTHLWRNLFIHLGFSIFFSFVVLSVAAVVSWNFGYPNLARNPTFLLHYRNSALSIFYFHQGLTIYWATLAVAHALRYYRDLRAGEARAAHLSAQLAQAQLQALKMQIHPHFLFNTLNSIAALLHKDIETADRMVARLGDFLRLTLKRSDAQTVSFAQELEFLKCYLEIELTRFADRLTVETEAGPDALAVPVPNLILQPLVENAIRHGIARRTTAGSVAIRAVIRQNRLVMQVEDNGPGLNSKPNGRSEGGLGLRNTRARLEQFYGLDFRLDIAERAEGGVIATVEIPAQQAA